MPAHPPERIDLEQLVLRRATEADAELLAAAVAANLDHLVPWMPWASAQAATLSSQRERLQAGGAAWSAGTDYQFLLFARDEEELLGVLGLHRRIGPRAIELGYWLDHGAVGHGYASAAAEALTAAALTLSDVERVEIHCDEANLRSRRIPERLGFRLARTEPDGIEAPGEIGRSMIWVFPPD